MLAVRGAKAAKTARYVKNVTNLIGNGVTFLRSTGEAISGAIDVVSNYIKTGEMDWDGLGAVGLNCITAAMSGKAALSSGNALRKALSEDNVAGKIKNSLGKVAGKAKSGVKAFLADNRGMVDLDGFKGGKYSGTGEYGSVGGHHVHAKAGFKGDVNYDPDKGFSISQQFMRDNNLNHSDMTSMQRKLFKELYESGRANTLEEHTRIAREALRAGGASDDMIDDLIQMSLENLTNQGVSKPTRIPWYTK